MIDRHKGTTTARIPFALLEMMKEDGLRGPVGPSLLFAYRKGRELIRSAVHYWPEEVPRCRR